MAKTPNFTNPSVPKTINTVSGTAQYVKTEIEDEFGRWNDNYSTRDGYWVIHEGNHHHVYKIQAKSKGDKTYKTNEGMAMVNRQSDLRAKPNYIESFNVPPKTKKGKGWHESPGSDGKAPIHKEVATRAQAKGAQNKPMKKKETLFEKWAAHLNRLDRNGKGFEMFDSNTDNESVEKLEEILKGGQEALDTYIESLREYNFETEYEMFKGTYNEFLKDEGIDPDTIQNEDEFRLEFESHINYNIGKFFDYPVLLLEKNKYEVSYDGASSEIDESDTDGKEFKKKALKYITEKQFNTILINSYGGVGYFGIIIHASEIIEAIQNGNKTISDSDLVVGIHDWMNGAGDFERATVRPNYEISLDNAELDSGEYGIGGVFGTSEWNWR